VVTFNLGAVGYVTSATKNTLVVKFTTPPSVGTLKAVVTSFGGASNSVQVATVQPTTTTSASYDLYGEEDDGVYPQKFVYNSGINNGYTVQLNSFNMYIDIYDFETYDSNGASTSAITWTGTTNTSNYMVTMTATTSETNVSGYFTFNAAAPGFIDSYDVYDGQTLLASGEKASA